MAEIVDYQALRRCIRIVRAAADWEVEAHMLSRAEYHGLIAGLDALTDAVTHLTPELPDDFGSPDNLTRGR